MDNLEWADISLTLENTETPDISRETALAFLDKSRRLKAPLSVDQVNKISTILHKTAPEGYQKEVQQYGSSHRHIWRRRGSLLPSESGDDTP